VACGPFADADSAIPASDRLQRELKLAVSIGDQTRAEQTCDSMFELFSRISQTWGWVTLFDIFDEQQKVRLTDLQRAVLVAGLEAYITEVACKAAGAILHVAARLVRHY
jgi:hypothetical protein